MDPGVPPSLEERMAMWKSIDFPVRHESHPRTREFIAALDHRLANGSALFVTFWIPVHPTLEWYLENNDLVSSGLLEHFWLCHTPARVFPYKPHAASFHKKSLFTACTPFHLGAAFSECLYWGGAYSDREHYASEARILGEAAAEELLAGDYEEPEFFVSREAWSGFFMNGKWDNTIVLIRPHERLIHVLMSTDAD